VRRAPALLWLGIVLLGASTAPAHTGGSTGYAAITVSGNALRYRLTLSPAAAPPGLAEELARARAGRADSRERLLALIRDKVRLDADGRRCEPAQGFVDAPRADVESVTLTVLFACAAAVHRLSIRDDLFDALGPDHHTLAKVEWPQGARQLAFEAGAREAQITLGESSADAERGGSFFHLGVEHILTGYDHLLFLAALLLRGGRVASLLTIITAFTIAHSITLALAVLGVIAVPGQLVEPAIALSIVWVAVENLALTGAPSRRWLMSFAFGLVHGLGFASVLEPLSLPPARLAWALLEFNLGVEAGQALVVVLLLPGLVWMRGKTWEPRAVRTASLAVAAVGLAWFVERVFFA
jgi:hydrogenase/urease accessory protein HupE